MVETSRRFKKTANLGPQAQNPPTLFIEDKSLALILSQHGHGVVSIGRLGPSKSGSDAMTPPGTSHHRQSATSEHPKPEITKECRGSASDGWWRCS